MQVAGVGYNRHVNKHTIKQYKTIAPQNSKATEQCTKTMGGYLFTIVKLLT